MHKNVFSYYIGVCLSCLELLLMYRLTYCSLLIIFLGVFIIFSLFFIIVNKKGNSYLRKDISEDSRRNNFLWIYDEEHCAFLVTVFTCAKILLFIAYVFILLIPIKNMSFTIWSVLPVVILILTIYWKVISSNYSSDDYKISSWENELSVNERFYLYKSLHSFVTMAILPIFTLCFYGTPIVRSIAPFIILAILGATSSVVSKFTKFE